MAQRFSIFWITPLNCGWMTKYIIGEFFSSGGATLYKNPSDQTVTYDKHFTKIIFYFFREIKNYSMDRSYFLKAYYFLPAGAQLGVHKRICTPSIRGFSLKLKTLHSIKAEVGWISFTFNFRSVYTSSMPGLGAKKKYYIR